MNNYKIFSFIYKDKFYVVKVFSHELVEFLKFYRNNRLESFVYKEGDKPICVKDFFEDVKMVNDYTSQKNAYDSIMDFIKSDRNTTKYLYDEISKDLVESGCYSIAVHVKIYIETLGETIENLEDEIKDLQNVE